MQSEINQKAREFLSQHEARVNIGNNNSWRITYKRARCIAVFCPGNLIDTIEITPLNSADDIGSGAGTGGAVYKEFSKK